MDLVRYVIVGGDALVVLLLPSIQLRSTCEAQGISLLQSESKKLMLQCQTQGDNRELGLVKKYAQVRPSL